MKKLYFLSFILGLICSFGQPPFNFVLSSLSALALFFYFFDQCNTSKQTLIFSFFFGYGYCFYSHHWLLESLLAYGDQLLWLMPFGLFLIPAVFAPYFALAGFLIKKFARKNILIMALFWLISEYLRSYGYIESPWLLIGYIWSDSEIISQSVSLFGIWGLSYLTIIWAGAIYHALLSFNHPKYFHSILVGLFSFIACHIYGGYHLNTPVTAQTAKIRIVQSNIDNNVFSRLKNRYNNLQKLIKLSESAKDINFIIWPEGSHEYNIDSDFLNLVTNIIPPKGYLILNANRVQNDPLKHWNSMFVINKFGNIVDSYDKIHLVALGEYIPLRTYIPLIQKITPGALDYSRGELLKSMHVKPAFMPSICYEDAFPEYPNQHFSWIVNITNDGWFGTSIGPYQHLSIGKFRAIEHGVPMVRAALTGISAVIDSFGRIVKSAPLLTEAVIDVQLPSYIINSTYYHMYGFFGIILLIVTLFTVDRFLKTRLANYSSIFKQ